MSWEDLFIPKDIPRIRSRDKCITFYKTPSGTVNILFNSIVLRDIKENYMTIGYSKSNNAIVLFFTNATEQTTTKKITRRKNGNTATAAIQSFLNLFSLKKEDVLGRYTPKIEKINGANAFVIYLRQKNEADND
ncbi:MAG TPA: hypothetical protein VFF27_07245 [Bacteroidia bacterium]|jgi:hypothetical protein|nr:hypothetical protein [Bacteroidia bacterium]